MFDFNKRVFILLGITAALIIAVIFYFLFWQKDTESESETVTGQEELTLENETENSTISENETTSTTTVIESTEDQTERYVRQISRIFVERFGTYSNENPTGHIEAVKDMITARMLTWVNTQAVSSGNGYYGVTTNVVASQVESIDSGTATVSVQTQRLSENGVDRITSQQSGTVGLVKIGGEWKINSFFWD